MMLGATLLAGCTATAPSKVRVDMAESGLPNCQSFEWLPTPQQPASLAEQRVKSQVMARLKEKGYTEAAEKGDCRVTYVLDIHERPVNKPGVGVGVGGGSGGVGGGIGISLPIGKRAEQAGTFTIDIVDAAKNAQVWSGSLDASFLKAEPNDDEAREIVARVLEKYPDRASK
jgi:hypothetical protein